jgi:hypothetical protein
MVSLSLGFVPAIAGVSITLLLVPLQAALVQFVGQTRRATAQWTDERVRLTLELIQVSMGGCMACTWLHVGCMGAA